MMKAAAAFPLSPGTQEYLEKPQGKIEKHMYENYTNCILYDLRTGTYSSPIPNTYHK
jgi:hypothetical protein